MVVEPASRRLVEAEDTLALPLGGGPEQPLEEPVYLGDESVAVSVERGAGPEDQLEVRGRAALEDPGLVLFEQDEEGEDEDPDGAGLIGRTTLKEEKISDAESHFRVEEACEER